LTPPETALQKPIPHGIDRPRLVMTTRRCTSPPCSQGSPCDRSVS